jgi:hypothetical protein
MKKKLEMLAAILVAIATISWLIFIFYVIDHPA